MAKTNFINKRFLIIVIVIIALAVSGFFIYKATRPKVDLTAPYDYAYSAFVTDTNNTQTSMNKVNDLLVYLEKFSLQDAQVARIATNLKYNFINKQMILQTLNKNNIFILQNVKFIENGGNLINEEIKLKEILDNLLTSAQQCVSYSTTYFKPLEISNQTASISMLNHIKIYRNYYNTLIDNYLAFYTQLSNIMANNAVSTIMCNVQTTTVLKLTVDSCVKLNKLIDQELKNGNNYVPDSTTGTLVEYNYKDYNSSLQFINTILSTNNYGTANKYFENKLQIDGYIFTLNTQYENFVNLIASGPTELKQAIAEFDEPTFKEQATNMYKNFLGGV